MSNPFEEIISLQNQMIELLQSLHAKRSDEKEILDATQLEEYLGICAKTRVNWVNSGHLIQHGIGKRVYYFKDEVIECIKRKGGKYGRN